MSNELALPTLDALKDFAQTALRSGLLPPAIKSPEAAFVIIATGRELGLSPMQSLRGIHVISGRPVLSAQMMLAIAKRSPSCVYFQLVESTTEQAIYETQRRGDPKPTRLVYTLDDARRAKLTNNPTWSAHPAAMLRARCSSALARDVYPDELLGIYEEDEGREIAGEYRAEVVTTTSDTPLLVQPTQVKDLSYFLRAIAGAQTMDDLLEVGAQIALVPKTLADQARDAYKARRAALTPPLRPAPSTVDSTQFDQSEAKAWSAREAVEKAKSTAQHHPPIVTLTEDELTLLRLAGDARTPSDLQQVAQRVSTVFCSPAATRAIDEAIAKRRKAITPPAEGERQLTDPAF